MEFESDNNNKSLYDKEIHNRYRVGAARFECHVCVVNNANKPVLFIRKQTIWITKCVEIYVNYAYK